MTGTDAVGSVELRLDGTVLWARIVAPGTRNAISTDVLTGMEEMVAAAREHRVKVLVIRGSDGTFCSGADLRELQGMLVEPISLAGYMNRLGAVFEQLEEGAWVTIAIVEGHALAGGCELLLACDIVIASTSSRIGDAHVVYGLVPAAGGSVRLLRSVPSRKAKYLLLTGDTISGSEAVDVGIATVAVPPEFLDAETARIVDLLTSRGRATLRTIKKMLSAHDHGHLQPLLSRELDAFMHHVAEAPDATLGIEAFLQNRVPVFDAESSEPATNGSVPQP